MLTNIVRFFTWIPFGIFLLTMLTFVGRLRLGVRGRALWAMALLFCCSKFLCFQELGGHAFCPAFPAPLIWFWSWAYSGAVILCALSIPFFFRFRFRGLVLPVVAWGLSLWGVVNGLVAPTVREVELVYADLPDALVGYRIVQLSDLHASSAARAGRTREVVSLANALKPDLICLTGDYQDGRAEVLHEVLAPLADLKARDGVWAVTGNHEHLGQHAGWWTWYGRYGLRFLRNDCVFPHPGLALGGVDDFRVASHDGFPPGSAAPNVGTAFAAATNGEFRILLQHQPRMAYANIEGHDVRLQLSGHTHGGIMPGFAKLVRRHNGGFVRGLYEFPHGKLYVNAGCGQWPGFPIRFFNDSEITLITLRRK